MQRLSLGTPGRVGPGRLLNICLKLFWFTVLFSRIGAVRVEHALTGMTESSQMPPPKAHICNRKENWTDILHYDLAKKLSVPTGPWNLSDEPEVGKIHLVIYVGGDASGDIEDPATGRSLDKRSVPHIYLTEPQYKMRDPDKGKRDVVGTQKLHPCHDGFNQMMRHRWLNPTTSETRAGLRTALKDICLAVKCGAEKAKSSAKVRMTARDGSNRWVHKLAIAIKCHRGRHRAVMSANETARRARRRGFTTELVFATLYRSTVDDRGPCGCHHGPWCCRLTFGMSYQGRDRWVANEEDLRPKNDRKADEIYEELGPSANFSGYEEGYSPQPAPPAVSHRGEVLGPPP